MSAIPANPNDTVGKLLQDVGSGRLGFLESGALQAALAKTRAGWRTNRARELVRSKAKRGSSDMLKQSEVKDRGISKPLARKTRDAKQNPTLSHSTRGVHPVNETEHVQAEPSVQKAFFASRKRPIR